MRKGMRGLVAHFGAIGIPASRVALELQFQSAPGQGGRQGLQPTAAWLEIVKLEALAAKQVAAEYKIEGIWSWGWPSFSVAGQRPRQARGRVRLALDARPEALRRRRPSPAPASTRRSPRASSSCRPASAARSATRTIAKDDVGRDGGADRRPRLGGDARCCERVVLRADQPVDTADRARRRARDRARPLRRQRRRATAPRSPPRT